MIDKTLNEAALVVLSATEEIGALITHIREADSFAADRSLMAATACADDAQEAIDNAIRELSKARDLIGRWALIQQQTP